MNKIAPGLTHHRQQTQGLIRDAFLRPRRRQRPARPRKALRGWRRRVAHLGGHLATGMPARPRSRYVLEPRRSRNHARNHARIAISARSNANVLSTWRLTDIGDEASSSTCAPRRLPTSVCALNRMPKQRSDLKTPHAAAAAKPAAAKPAPPDGSVP